MSRDANRAVSAAQHAVEQVEAVGYAWRLIDPASGPDPVDLDKLLELAKRARDTGRYKEAIRIGRRIVDAARLGIKQARAQQNAAPYYPAPQLE